MPRIPIGTPDGTALEIDTDNVAAFGPALNTYVANQRAAAAAAPQAEADALRGVVAGEVLALRSARLGAALNVTEEGAHLLTLNAAQLSRELANERATALAVDGETATAAAPSTAAAPQRATSDAPPANPGAPKTPAPAGEPVALDAFMPKAPAAGTTTA